MTDSGPIAPNRGDSSWDKPVRPHFRHIVGHALARAGNALPPIVELGLHDGQHPCGCADRRSGEVVVLARGEIDLATATGLQAELISAVNGHTEVCCDLGQVTFFSAAGVTALLIAAAYAERTGCRFTVRGAYGITRKILRLAKADHLLERPQDA